VRIAPQASAIPSFATARLWKYIFYSSTTSCARSSTSWDHFRKAQSALPLPSRYQHHINLLKTFDKLAKGCVSVAAR
jgi:hypothetical protein